jgi:hypothetical protein
MALDTYPCPACNATLRGSPHLQPGDLVQCPKCRTQFAVPEPGPDTGLAPDRPTPRTEEPARPGDFSEAPERAWPRFSEAQDEYAEGRPPRLGYEEDEDYPRRRTDYRPPADLSSEYTIDLGLWFRYATAHWGSVLGPAIGFLILSQLISLALGFVPCGGLLQIVIMPPLQAGMTIVCLAQLKGRHWTFGDFFSGFQSWGALVGNALLIGVIFLACLVPAGIIAVVVAVAASNAGQGPDVGVVAALVVAGLLYLLGLVYVLLRMSFFSVPLIIDRNYGPWEAIQGSWALTRGHFWGLLGVSLVVGLINLGGLLLLLVGALFTAPLTTLVETAGYLLVAGTRPPLPEPKSRLPEEY